MKIPNARRVLRRERLSLARIVSEDSQRETGVNRGGISLARIVSEDSQLALPGGV